MVLNLILWRQLVVYRLLQTPGTFTFSPIQSIMSLVAGIDGVQLMHSHRKGICDLSSPGNHLFA
jgi:hypothetical protein